ncbi:hypothetical protein [Corynebacterium epidermidicanis]|uniref:Uncharacterized protein n=1 Tax=Corynebacterium epidermidicanis TaxID=1050174 RepID=A0A0G3GR87_9CORY|nr:hypothetical protein [Corynebacterium epidermidicanis]AKK03686.1 hypothetical protein CEPID_09200 [Corynebacterium epidermidicanis]
MMTAGASLSLAASNQVARWSGALRWGAHAVSMYLLGVLAAAIYDLTHTGAQADFGWTMYAPLSDASHSSRYTSSLYDLLQNYGPTFPHWVALLAAVAVCGLAAWHRGPGPVEHLMRATYRRL